MFFEDTCKVPMKFLERKIHPRHVELDNMGRRAKRDKNKIDESFLTTKNKYFIYKKIGHRKTTCSE